MNLSDPTDEDIERLAEQWLFVKQTVEGRYGHTLNQSRDDLTVLQRLLDDSVFSSEKTWELEAMRVALGRVLARNIDGLDWAIIDDEYGRDATIRYRDSQLVFNVTTMLLRRVEDAETVDVHGLFNELLEHLDELKDEVD